MLYATAELSTPKRLQGAFVSDDEIKRVVEFLKSKYEPTDYDTSIVERSSSSATSFHNGIPVEEDSDPMIPAAKEEILRAGKASASLLQRRLKVGYARAARLLDLLEQEGFIGPGDGAKPREILKVEFTRQMDQVPTPAAAVEEDEPEAEEEEEIEDEEGEEDKF
jgi:S-DNA-T family DNA segregation ATPase FtsK/SpoIIIE